MTLDELEKKLQEDLKIDEDNISQVALHLGNTYHRYLRMLTNEKFEQNKLEQERIDLYKHLYHDLQKKGFDGYSVGKQKAEIEVYIGMNEKYREISKKMAKNEIFIKHIEMALENINKVSFNIKNYIECEKLKRGII